MCGVVNANPQRFPPAYQWEKKVNASPVYAALGLTIKPPQNIHASPIHMCHCDTQNERGYHGTE